jgi:hypothetical protein
MARQQKRSTAPEPLKSFLFREYLVKQLLQFGVLREAIAIPEDSRVEGRFEGGIFFNALRNLGLVPNLYRSCSK